MCTHTLSIIERLTVNLTTWVVPWPRGHPNFSKSCLSEVIFSCVHTIIVAVKFWYSRKEKSSCFYVFFRSAAHNSSGKENLSNPGLSLQRPASYCGRKYYDRALAMGHLLPLHKCI